MPVAQLDPTVALHYQDDYFGEPWQQPETVLLVHGVAESSQAWFAWVPHLARCFRVLRPDLRGFGRSSIPPPEYRWSPSAFAADLVRFLEVVGVRAAHIVGAKLGGTIAMQFAADYPERTISLSVVSSPVQARNTGGRADLGAFADRVKTAGVAAWAAETQRARLGTEVPEAQIAWWTAFMGATDPGVCRAVTAMAGGLDISASLPRIQAPALIVTTEGSALASVETVREWQEQIPHSELLVLPGDSYHVAAARPDECAQHVLAFIRRHKGVD